MNLRIEFTALRVSLGSFGYNLRMGNLQLVCMPHGIWDPHFSLSLNDAYCCGLGPLGSDYTVLISYWLLFACWSGIYNSVFQVYNFVITHELLAVISISLAKIHLICLDSKLQSLLSYESILKWPLPLKLYLACFDLV